MPKNKENIAGRPTKDGRTAFGLLGIEIPTKEMSLSEGDGVVYFGGREFRRSTGFCEGKTQFTKAAEGQPGLIAG